MRIESLEVENFLRIRHLDREIGADRMLVAGHNEAGKTSLREALRFLLIGDSPRATKKKDYHQLLSHGAKKGRVSAQIDGASTTRNVKDGKEKGRDPVPLIENTVALEIAIGARTFSSLPAKDKRVLLFDLLDVDMKPDTVMERMQRRGLPDHMAERVKPLLRAGFTAASKDAKENASRARGQWEAATGDRYGSQKAEDYEVERPETAVDAAAVGRLQKKADATSQARADANADLRQAERASQTEAVDPAEIKKSEKAAKDAEKALVAKREALGKARDQRKQAGGAVTAEQCPRCEGAIHIIEGDPIEVLAEPPEIPDAGKLDEKIRDLQIDVSRLDADLNRARARLDQLKRQQDAEKPPSPDQMAKLRKAVEDAEAKHSAASEELREAAQAFRAASEADERQKNADQAHQSVQDWSLAAELLGPDGVPGEILAEALTPFNERVAKACKVAGWPVWQLGADMEISRGENAESFPFISESAQWRVDAVAAAAVAFFSGAQLLVLDRLDVLDVAGRKQALQWLHGITGPDDAGLDQVIVLGTFADRPQMPDGWDLIWLEKGAEVPQ